MGAAGSKAGLFTSVPWGEEIKSLTRMQQEDNRTGSLGLLYIRSTKGAFEKKKIRKAKPYLRL